MSTDLVKLTEKDVPLFSFAGLTATAKVVRVVDGDTVHVITFVRGDFIRLVCRLHGIDTPEMSKMPVKAKIARNRLLQLCTNCQVDIDDMSETKNINKVLDTNTKILHIEFYGKEKYGRELAKLYDDNACCLNDVMVSEGYARIYDGGKKQEWED
jgi:endonuclease YncB( thermonuclease family)